MPPTVAEVTGRPDLVGGCLQRDAVRLREAPVEGRHLVPEVGRRAGDTPVPGLHRPAGTFVISHRRTILVRLEPFASHIIETPAETVSLVAPLPDILPRIEMGFPLAVVMNLLSEREKGPPQGIDCGRDSKGQVVDERRRDVLGIDGSAGEVYDGRPGDHVPHPDSAGGIRVGLRDAAESGAGPHREGGDGVPAHLPDDIDGTAACDTAICAILSQRDGTLDRREVVSFVVFQHVGERPRSLRAGRCHDGLAVVEGQDIEDQFGDGRLRGPQQRFRISRAALTLNPDEDRFLFRLQRMGNLRHKARRKPEHRGHGRAKLEKIAAGDAPVLQLREQVIGGRTLPPLSSQNRRGSLKEIQCCAYGAAQGD